MTTAEADGNRTRLSRGAAHTGFEDLHSSDDVDTSSKAAGQRTVSSNISKNMALSNNGSNGDSVPASVPAPRVVALPACRRGRPCGTVLRVSVRRIMTDLPSRAPAGRQEFYRRVVGSEPVMDLGWIVSLADPVRPGVRLSLFSHDESAPPAAGIVFVEIDDVEASVRRFIACDPDGTVVNVLSHR